MDLVARIAVTAVGLCSADLPIDCRFSDAVGTWIVSESARTGDSSLECTEVGEVVYEKQFTLTYPNLATDELGNAGTWTLVYNQGFEVNINERSYWASFNYDADGYYCDQLFTGWSRDKTVRHWSCFTAVKAGTQQDQPKGRPFIDPALENLDELHVNDLERIERINSLQKFWTAKAYPQHEKYTRREMLRRGGSLSAPLPPPAPATEEQKARAALLPTSFDWRNVSGVNYVSPVRDQASCGSCYVFASTGMLEARLRIATNFSRMEILSAQDVVSCSKISEGCAGGFAYLIAGRYGQDQGFVAEQCNEYQGVNTLFCNTDMSCDRVYVSQYRYIGGYYGGCNEQLMLEALISEGPLAVNFEVTDDFYNYESGIYVHVDDDGKTDFNPFILRLVALLALACVCSADLPVDCRYSDALGTWFVSESARTGDASLLLPSQFDWRDVHGVNYVSPVRHQLQCGSCYAFASAGMLEARLRISTNLSRTDIFSPQDIVSCSHLSEGCDGGFGYLIAGRYAKEQGVVDESCNKYRGKDTPTCTTDPTCDRTYVNEYEYVGGYYGACNEEAMLDALVSDGPLMVGFLVTSDFRYYGGGIYVAPPKALTFDPFVPTNHAVVVVGYGVDEESGMKFWIVKNSWGAHWGENGYFRIRRGTNEVGIESMAFGSKIIP
ncbi:Peptidase C1A papain C-terminal [Trinorchestia longiramus]|nr:Peptidase C1A papain C-terminal [Trinorchestia longiramus]